MTEAEYGVVIVAVATAGGCVLLALLSCTYFCCCRKRTVKSEPLVKVAPSKDDLEKEEPSLLSAAPHTDNALLPMDLAHPLQVTAESISLKPREESPIGDHSSVPSQ